MGFRMPDQSFYQWEAVNIKNYSNYKLQSLHNDVLILCTAIHLCFFHERNRTNISLPYSEVVKPFLSVLHQFYASLLFWKMHTLVSVISAWNCWSLSALSSLAFLISAAFRRFAHLVYRSQISFINMIFLVTI